MTPSVSVLLPAFNGAGYLREQVASILGQSFADIELLTIDDGSHDGTASLLAELAAQDPRMRVLSSTGNCGQNARLAQLTAAARGRHIALSDQDDVWNPDKLGLLVSALDVAALAFGSSWIIDGEGRAKGYTLLDQLLPLPRDGDRLTFLFKPTVSGHAMVVRKDWLNPMVFQRGHIYDWLISIEAAFGDGVHYVPDAVTWHRIHATNQMNGPSGTRGSVLARVSPNHLRRLRNLRTTERLGFVQRLEHAAGSPLLSEELRAVFRSAYRACTAAWFDLDRPALIKNRALEQRLSELLLPLAGSDADRAYAIRSIGLLTQATVHPWSMLRYAKMALVPPKRGTNPNEAPRQA